MFVLQCGDPTGSGGGSPGFFYAEENLPTGKQVPYPKGSIAMAKTSAPNSTGSQFFINYQDSPLDPAYTYVGSVIRGLDLVEQVAKGGDDASFGANGGGKPKVTMTIKSITFY
jgi:peptidyl-prolyl cis-trans isomerase B (cyclophilin B)